MDPDNRPLGTLTLLFCAIVCVVVSTAADLFRRRRRSPHIIALGAACLALPACDTLTPAPTVQARAVTLDPAVQEVRKAVRVSADIGASLDRQATALDRQRAALARQRAALRRAQLLLDGKTVVTP
ncbi:MAG: hypothetical protein JSR82_24355 [Verrucomicrobia bacterium]|nr:hypothetical protein [Verrucomicrobiota bacterium]